MSGVWTGYGRSVRRLLPDPIDDLDPVAAVAAEARPDGARTRPPRRPWLMVNMVTSVDGGVEIDGRSGGLGTPGDRAMFRALRAVADSVLVAAGTAREEGYGPPMLPDALAETRLGRGQRRLPRLALVSRSARLDPTSRLFADGHRPRLYVPETAEVTAGVAAVTEVRRAGGADTDLAAVLADLAADGDRVVLAEGGPSLNGQLLAEDLVDELCLTVSPLVVGGDASRIARHGPTVAHPLTLTRVFEEDGALFLRYLRSR